MHHQLGIAGVDGADARKRQLQFRGQRSDRVAPAWIGGEDQLVVIAAGEHAVAFELAVAERSQRGRARNALEVERRAHLRALEDVAEVARQPVGDVDRGVREAPQALAELDPRLGLVQPPRRGFDFGMLEPKCGATELARDPDVVARQGGAAIHRHAGRHFAERDDADRAQRRARGVAADQLDAEAIGEREEARGKLFQPFRLGRRNAEGEKRPARRRAHGGKVGKVHGERLVPERARRGVRQEMLSFDEHVGGDGELEARVRAHQRAIVADTEQRTVRRPIEEAPNELELA